MKDDKPSQHIEYKDSTHIGDNIAGDVYRQTVKPRTISPDERARAMAVPKAKEHRLVPVVVRYGGNPPEEYEFGRAVCQLLRECDFLVQEACSQTGVNFVITERPPLTGTVLEVYRGEQIDAVIGDLRAVLDTSGIKYELLDSGTFVRSGSRWADPPITLTVVKNPLEYEKK
jgi:hypothetical protein